MSIKDALTKEYVVLHTAVDTFFQGQVITQEHLRGGLDREIDMDRLVALGAIAPVDSEEGKTALSSVEAGATTPAGDPIAAPVPVPTADATTPKAAKSDTKTS